MIEVREKRGIEKGMSLLKLKDARKRRNPPMGSSMTRRKICYHRGRFNKCRRMNRGKRDKGSE